MGSEWAMLDHLKQIYLREAFRPGIVGLLTNPFYAARKGLYKHVSALAHLVQGRVLDVGCGQKPYEKLFKSSEYLGLELDNPENRRNKKADVFYDGHVLPFSPNSFDTVIANQVLEHVFTPDDFLRELNRVLKVQGGLLLTVPFVWDEHEQPFDYARYSSFGISHLLKKHGFGIVEHRKSVCDVRVILQLANCYLYKSLRTRSTLLNLATWVAFASPLNILGEILGSILPSTKDLYLDNIVFARKMSDDS
jgi:SAM-dependent methyltransferase